MGTRTKTARHRRSPAGFTRSRVVLSTTAGMATLATGFALAGPADFASAAPRPHDRATKSAALDALRAPTGALPANTLQQLAHATLGHPKALMNAAVHRSVRAQARHAHRPPASPVTTTPTPAPTAPTTATGNQIDMRVLVLATDGDPNPDGIHSVPAGSWDWDLSTLTSALDGLGVPYDTYKSTTKQLCVGGTWRLDWTKNASATDTTCSTGNVVDWANGVEASMLSDGAAHAYYQGVMQTNGTLSYVDSSGAYVGSALTTDEWTALWGYEQQFGIRTVSANTYPTADFGLAYKGEDGTATTATWTSAGGTTFPYVNTSGTLPITNAWTYRASVAPGDTTTTPLLTDAAGDVLAAVHTYPAQGNRQALALTFDSAGYLTHGEVLGYGLVSWVTGGLFLGERHAYLDPEPDDMFIDDSIWQGPKDKHPTVCGTAPDDPSLPTYRITGFDLAAYWAWQNSKQRSSLAPTLRTEFPFNGEGTTSGYLSENHIWFDTLTPVARWLQSSFKWVNHTWDHQNLDGRYLTAAVSTVNGVTTLTLPAGSTDTFTNSWGHTVIGTGIASGTTIDTVTSPTTAVLSKAATATGSSVQLWVGVTYNQVQQELQQNIKVAQKMGFSTFNAHDLVQPDISGLTNQDFLQSANDNGIQFLISDTSRTGDPHTYGANEGVFNTGTYNTAWPGADPAKNSSWSIFEIARYPTNLYYNVNTPDRWLAEDNCLYPTGSYGHVDSYAQLLDRESTVLVRYLLSGSNRPLMFHQPNLTAYDGRHSLLSDLLDATLAKYSALVNVPITSPTMDELGQKQLNRLQYNQALASGALTASYVPGQSITLTANADVTVPVTGLAAGTGYQTENYAGQSISYVTLKAGQTVTLPLSH